jgi:DNA-binding Lrp family transcriptional regulator
LQAYVLIHTEAEKGLLAEELRTVPGVVSAEDVIGAYDAIAVARSESMQYLTEVILPEIRNLPGVTRALPAPLLDSRENDRESGSPFQVSLAPVRAA